MITLETVRNIYGTHTAVRRLAEVGLPESHVEVVVREQVHLISTISLSNQTLSPSGVYIEKLRLETETKIETPKLIASTINTILSSVGRMLEACEF